MKRSRLSRAVRYASGLAERLRSEPDYAIELMLDYPTNEGISPRGLFYKHVKSEAKRRGIKKGDSDVRAKRIFGLTARKQRSEIRYD